MEELYTLEREVGRGSYGVVFEGQMAKTGHRVAIKRLPCSNPECIELYLQELWAMRATAKNHVNVIALHSCLLQTGPRSLKPLKHGKLPLGLVESVLKGSIVRRPQSQEGNNVQSNTHRRSYSTSRLQDRTNTVQARAKLQDKTRSSLSDSTTPQRPPNRARKRPAQREEEQPGPLRRLALWLVMEYCDGGDLNQYLLSRPPDAQRNHSVVQQLCSAVAFLHSLGITHRDLKPDNVLVCVTPKGPIIKVADFGLSKMSEGVVDGDLSRQRFSSTCGSDFYMAPEVWGGLSYSAQADIFSLGVMFWAVLERITFLEEGSTQEQLAASEMITASALAKFSRAAAFYLWQTSDGWQRWLDCNHKQHLSRLVLKAVEAKLAQPEQAAAVVTSSTRSSPQPQVLRRLSAEDWFDCCLSSWPEASFSSKPFEANPERVTMVRLSSGAYVCKGRSGWLMPLGEALWDNADLQLCIPMKFKRAPPLPPPPGPAMCSLLLNMLASNPDARPPADQLETRVRSALKEDSR